MRDWFDAISNALREVNFPSDKDYSVQSMSKENSAN